MTSRAIILAGYGLNCEDETKFAFELAGGRADIVHLNDLIADRGLLKKYQILAVPGGFSFGDDTGSGKAYANKMKNHLKEELDRFLAADKLALGICNGFQILTHLNFLPGALLFNNSARYVDRWVDLRVVSESPWLTGIRELSLPIAHGEGRYHADGPTLRRLNAKKQIALKYVKGGASAFHNLSANPNGALENIAAVTSVNGKVLGLMPHPERGMFFTQLPHWTWLREKLEREGKKPPTEGPGLRIFQNAVDYFG